jgi:hypothetical protein
MKELVDLLRGLQACVVKPSTGFPYVDQLDLPEDLGRFYLECGGIELFTNKPYPLTLAEPGQFLRANPEIAMKDDPTGDISDDWYIIGRSGSTQYITIDLNPSRLGRCYDSFWDMHACPGDSPVIALTFTDLLTNLIRAQGDYLYWTQSDFVPLGDAYD